MTADYMHMFSSANGASHIDTVSNVSGLRCRPWKKSEIYDRDI